MCPRCASDRAVSFGHLGSDREWFECGACGRVWSRDPTSPPCTKCGGTATEASRSLSRLLVVRCHTCGFLTTSTI
jgi:uncharacterized Zn finger protein